MKIKSKNIPIPGKYEYTEVLPREGQPKGTLIPLKNPGSQSNTEIDGIVSEAEIQPEDNTVQNQVTSQGKF